MGDERKGKIVNYLASNFGAACRYQGGHNAGHTLIIDGKKLFFIYYLHQFVIKIRYP